MDFKYSKLRGRIVEKYGGQGEFAKAAGLSETAMSMKLKGKRGFSQKDIVKWCTLLDVDMKDVGDYFYT
ncbi:MAG: DUF739 family protein [Lachnospiraceae bacterium]|nr:DUF739 family protein [Lachnospiraceae bacterium]